MNNLLRILGFLLTIAVFIAIGYGFYVGFFGLAGWLSGGLEQGTVFLLAICGVLIVCAWILSSAIRYRSNKAQTSNPDKVALYTRFVETISMGDKADFTAFEKYLLLWGSNRLVAQYARLQFLLEANPFDSKAVKGHLANMVREIRRDLGENNIGLTDKMIMGPILDSPAPAVQNEKERG